MIFDREAQRDIFLELIYNSSFKGSGIEDVYKLIQEIKDADVALQEDISDGNTAVNQTTNAAT